MMKMQYFLLLFITLLLQLLNIAAQLYTKKQQQQQQQRCHKSKLEESCAIFFSKFEQPNFSTDQLSNPISSYYYTYTSSNKFLSTMWYYENLY